MKIEFETPEEKERMVRALAAAIPRYEWCDHEGTNRNHSIACEARAQRDFLKKVKLACESAPVTQELEISQ